MNNKLIILILISFLTNIFIYGQGKRISYTVDNVKNSKKLFGEKINKDQLLYPCHIKWMLNNLFITNCANDTFCYRILNVQNGKIENNFVTHGRGPGEMLFPDYIQSIQMNENVTFISFDFMLRKLLFYDFEKILTNEKDIYKKEIIFPKNLL